MARRKKVHKSELVVEDGKVKLPRWVIEELGLEPGEYVEMGVDGVP